MCLTFLNSVVASVVGALPVDPDGFMPFQNNYWLWKGIGLAGTLTFFGRFLVQWVYSEKHKESKIPTIFWWQSLFGAILMLLYSLRQQDSIYILAYAFTVIPYTRNLILVYRKKREQQEQAAHGVPAVQQ